MPRYQVLSMCNSLCGRQNRAMVKIAATTGQQAQGIDEVNKALAQLDEVTQQNSALVEENAATAKTLEHQSSDMSERVAFFKLGAGPAQQAAPLHAAA